jgi:hypothetical protein
MAMEPGIQGDGQMKTSAGERTQQAAASASEHGRELATEVANQAGNVTGAAIEQTRQVAGEASQQLRSLANSAIDEVRGQADGQVDRLASNVQTFAGQLQALVDGRVEQAGPLPDYARQLSERLQRFSESMHEEGAYGAVDRMTVTARRRPGTFLLGAAVLGFAAGRLLRGMQASSSSPKPGDAARPSTRAFPPVDLTAIERMPADVADPTIGDPTYPGPAVGTRMVDPISVPSMGEPR